MEQCHCLNSTDVDSGAGQNALHVYISMLQIKVHMSVRIQSCTYLCTLLKRLQGYGKECTGCTQGVLRKYLSHALLRTSTRDFNYVCNCKDRKLHLCVILLQQFQEVG